AIAFGIGTSQVRDVLASQCLALDPLKVRRIDVNGRLGPGVYAKDVILTIIRQLGVNGGVGFAYEYGGTTVDRMTIEERMTMCNMSIEGGSRGGGAWRPIRGRSMTIASRSTRRPSSPRSRGESILVNRSASVNGSVPPPIPKRSNSWDLKRGHRSKARTLTWPSLDRAPTDGSRISRKQQKSSGDD